ncbi:BglG family transcription antiterminator [Bacillus sp. Marseille-P3661]|uniref:BglG family transcription antiterminator n=1 Tax=Bacillus sp. Marseille-P3661 TaxID=1936234 RepID=UPI000C815DF9|nr:HTH domain-containing protein [Bacillus sp. Marseille-P3661]
MQNLDNQFSLFLKVLLKQKKTSKISVMAKSLEISRRMIYYYMDRIDQILKKADLQSIHREETGGISLSTKQVKFLSSWLEKQDLKSYVFSTAERRYILIILILMETRKWNLQTFIDLMGVSRNTIIRDIQFIKEKYYPLELLSSKNKGYFFHIDELSRRNEIYQVIQEMNYNHLDEAYKFLMIEMLKKQLDLNNVNLEDKHIEIEKAFKEIEHDLKKEISEENIKVLARTTFLFWLRSITGNKICWNKVQEDMIRSRIEYKISHDLIQLFNDIFSGDFPEDEVLFFGLLLLCSQKNSDAYFRGKSFEELYFISNQMVEQFEEISGIHFENKEQLIENIQTDIKVIFYRKQFSFSMAFYQPEPVINKYEKVYFLTKKVVSQMKQNNKLFKNYFPNGFEENEIANLALYFEDIILKEQSNSVVYKIIIVSDLSKVYMDLLKTQILQLLPHAKIQGLFTMKEASNNKEKVHFCLTTQRNYVHNNGETIYVNPLLTNEDKNRIYYSITANSGKSRKEQLLEILTGYVNKNELDLLVSRIDSLYSNNFVDLQVKKTVNLPSILEHEHIFNVEQLDNLEKSIDLLAFPLLRKNIIDDTYVNQIKHEVLKERKFYLICPNVLILQTDNRYGSSQAAISLVYSKKSLVIQENPITNVNLIILIGTEEKMSHVPILFELEDLLQPTFLKKLDEGANLENLLLRTLPIKT